MYEKLQTLLYGLGVIGGIVFLPLAICAVTLKQKIKRFIRLAL